MGSFTPLRENSRTPELPQGRRRVRISTIAALVLASAVLIVVDATSPALDPARRIVAEVVGPAQSATSTLARPLTGLSDWNKSQDSLRADIAELEAANAGLTQQLESTDLDRARLAEYDGLTKSAQLLGYDLVPARVIAHGPGQTFEQTVTIDAGSASGLAPDMTVVAAEGLVGRVLRVSTTTATVLLIADADSTVGGRVGSSREVGFVRGSGALGAGHQLDLELLDPDEVPAKGDIVVTWGSSKGAPYVPGVPIGTIDSVYSSVRDSTQRARVTPKVSFSKLDLVGVAVPHGTSSDRAIIGLEGTLR